MTPEAQYAMGMAQVLATLAVAVAVIARRTSTRPLQSAQAVLHFALGGLGLLVLIFDVLVAGWSVNPLSSWLRPLNLFATLSLVLLMYALAPFFQTKDEKLIEAEAQQINRDRGGAGTKPSAAGGTGSKYQQPKRGKSYPQIGPCRDSAHPKKGTVRIGAGEASSCGATSIRRAQPTDETARGAPDVGAPLSQASPPVRTGRTAGHTIPIRNFVRIS